MISYLQFKFPTPAERMTFVKRLTGNIRQAGIEGLSLVLYGSLARGDADPTSYDADTALIYTDRFVIPRKKIMPVQHAVADAMAGSNVELNLNVLDLGTMQDGRFLSFRKHYKDQLMRDGVVLLGPDYRHGMNSLRVKYDTEDEICYALRKSREALFLAQANREVPPLIQEGFYKVLNTACNSGKRILDLLEVEFYGPKMNAFDTLKEHLPQANLDLVPDLRKLRSDKQTIEKIPNAPESMIELMFCSVDFIERIIEAYVNRYPDPWQRDTEKLKINTENVEQK